jgi:hypothetical protein
MVVVACAVTIDDWGCWYAYYCRWEGVRKGKSAGKKMRGFAKSKLNQTAMKEKPKYLF